MRRRILAALAALCLAACTRVGTQSGDQSGRHAFTVPGTLRIAAPGSPNTLNPLLSANTEEGFLNRLSFSLLITADATGKLVPDLAQEVPTLENGGISKDGLTVTYHLRKDVKWQDGVAFTSKDVSFSFRAIMNDANNVLSHNGYNVVASVATPDDATVVFHLKHRFSPFVDTVFAESDEPYCLVPEHILGKYKSINQVPFNQEPIGTGPYKVVRWVRGDHIEYAPFDGYFRGKPKLNAIVVKIIPDENTALNELRTHDVDWYFEASPSMYRILKTLPDVKNVLVDQNSYLGMLINTSRPVLSDIHVRRAIAYAIDKRRLVEEFTSGSATVATEDLPPFMWAYNPHVRVYPFDVQKAKAELRAAGWTPGPDGIMRKDGQRLTFTLTYNVESQTRKLAAVQVQSMLQNIGIDAPLKTYPGSLLFASAAVGGILNGGKYDLNISGWVAGIDPDNATQFACWAIPPAGENYTRYCSKTMDTAQTVALTQYDRETRKRAYATIESSLADDVPAVFFWWPRQVQPINPDFKGFAPNPVTESWNAYDWEI